MPDPWLTEEELAEHQKEVENHPLTKQAEEAKAAHEEDVEDARKEREENEKKVEEGELVREYANGAVVGYRDADAVEEPVAESLRPKQEAVDEGAAPDEPVKVQGSADDPKPQGKNAPKGDSAKGDKKE